MIRLVGGTPNHSMGVMEVTRKRPASAAKAGGHILGTSGEMM